MDTVDIKLTKDEAVVLFEFLTRHSGSDTLSISDTAEQKVLRKLSNLLEKVLPEPLSQNWVATRATKTSEVDIAMSFLEALGRLDFDAAASLLNEDAVLDLPYVNEGLIVRGRADILQFFRRSMSQSVSDIMYKLEQAYPSPEAGAMVLEISTQGRTATGREYTNHLVGIFVLHDGKIVLFREYFNSAKIV